MIVSSCRTDENTQTQIDEFHLPIKIAKHQQYKNAAVSSAHHLASEVGVQVLKDGGNAIDAAIAVQFALAVTYPIAGNIGGGGFMVIRTEEGLYDALDFRETAPANANKDMYLDADKNVIPNLSLLGHLACGVPGVVDGMEKAFDKYSKLKNWSRLVEPSIELAQRGFYVTNKQASSLNKRRKDFKKVNDKPIAFVKGKAWKQGDILTQPDLAKTLEAIAKNGRAGFYEGEVANLLVEEMNQNGGIINLEDLKKYTSKWRAPVVSDYRGYTIISMPPPSSGGIALIQLLNSIEPYNIESMGFHSTEAIHLMVEAERRVYADRSKHLGDMDFYDVPIATLIDDDYNQMRMSNFDPSKASLSSEIEPSDIKESEETTHFSIVDQWGNAVSLTTTINTGYGSKVVVDGAGFLLNNEMDDFSAKPGVPNFFGLVGNEANAIAPGKRMLSSMSPTIVEKDGELKIVVGTPGGSTIITSVFQTIVNIIDFGMNANAATQSCRFHHQWLPDKIQIEERCLDENIIDTLEKMGHATVSRKSIGKVETIVVNDDGILDAAADRRNDDSVSGY
ncbi:MAG: gamma-glutamyltransferase [Saprospiraceae bacterium]|nr:gamma-glutamyltransferase [Bacteroidia bacterium]NNL92878.1 gamma-glutamyltransferase [Saprospiraceae bacterium]